MKHLVFAIFAAQLLSSTVYAKFGDTPKETLDLKDGKTCYRFEDKVIYVQVHPGMDTPSVSVGQSKSTSKTPLKEECEKAKQKLVLKEIGDSEFLGVVGQLVFLEDFMGIPGSGKVRIYSLANGTEKLAIDTNGDPIELKQNQVIYFQPKETLRLTGDGDSKEILRRWKQMGCQKDWAEGGLGCTQIVKTVLDLKTLKLTGTKEMTVQPAQ